MNIGQRCSTVEVSYMNNNMEVTYRILGLLLFTLQHVNFGYTKPVTNCEFFDEEDSTIRFKFDPLSGNVDGHVVQDNDSEKDIRLQLCGSLRSCNDMTDYGVCLTVGKKEIGIGKAPPVVTVKAGKLLFNFTGDQCKDDKNYVVNVIPKCDNEDDYSSQPVLLPHKSDDCNFYIVWKTKAACREEIKVNCTAVDEKGQTYDISSLMLRSENYAIPKDSSDSMIILNVCHNVVYDEGAICERKTGVCLRKTVDQKTDYINYGDLNNPPYFENDVLTLKYDSGAICIAADISHVETTISFECDYHATDTLPIYKGGDNECRHRFHWRTAAACSIESLEKYGKATAGICKVTNPLTNVEYNVQDLMDKVFSVKTRNGVEYAFQVCGPVVNNSCPSGSGGCFAKNRTSTGKANTKLMWNQGGPYLNYTDGALCREGKQRYTLIAFFCGAEGSPHGPLIMEDENCALIIHWNTQSACQKRIECETKDHTISLASLIRSSDNYVIKANNTEFHINICRPLVPKPYLTCLHGSAACQVIPQQNEQFTNETSVGYPGDKPHIDKDKHVILHYSGGSTCPEDSQKMISTNLTFLCDYESAIGEPRYKYYESCTHVFEWTTSVACDKIVGHWGTGCTIENPLLSYKLNLTSLRDKPIHSVTSEPGDHYNISICGGNDYCNGSAVCKGDNSYGLRSVVIFDYNRNMIILKFVNGSKCGNGFYSSEVQFVCDETAGNGEPKWISETPCGVGFEWRTKVFCVDRSVNQISISDEPKVEETADNVKSNVTGHIGAHVGIAILVAGCVLLIICLWSSARRAHMRACFRSLTSRREHCRVQYTKLNATEEARLLLDITDTTQCQPVSESDDELLDA